MAWLEGALGFEERVRIGDSHRSQLRVGADGAMVVADVGSDRAAPDGRSKPAHFVAMEEALQRHFGTRVAIRPGRKQSKIEITFTSEDDLHRLLALLQRQGETSAADDSTQ